MAPNISKYVDQSPAPTFHHGDCLLLFHIVEDGGRDCTNFTKRWHNRHSPMDRRSHLLTDSKAAKLASNLSKAVKFIARPKLCSSLFNEFLTEQLLDMLKMKVYNVIKSKSTGKASSKAHMFVAVNLAIGLVKLKNIKGIWSVSLIQAQVLLCSPPYFPPRWSSHQ